MEDLARAIERWPLGVWRAADRLARELEAAPAFAAGLRQLPHGEILARKLALPPTDGLEWAIDQGIMRPRGTLHLARFHPGDHAGRAGVRAAPLVAANP